MKKGTKKVIGAVIAIVVVLVLAWLIYESVKPETVSIGATNELPNENMGLNNVTNDLSAEAVTNSETTYEPTNEVSNEANNVVEQETEDNNESEIVSGSSLSREERAVELAKEYYEEEYGSADGIYFEFDSLNEDGRYRVRAGTADSGTKYFLVDLNNETVEEYY